MQPIAQQNKKITQIYQYSEHISAIIDI